ncbi:branched-chain amino acid ABC transporter permease [Shimia sp.]|uniref:branched-chain amino acid ABC transporter permease n=1 Tax=Shimia sp. TaxID=1954381 RepID=UPI003298EF51
MTPTYRIDRWTTSSRISVWACALILLALCLVPLSGDDNLMSRGVVLFVYILLAATWNALAGFAGLMSVGQQAFFGLGAYFAIRLSDGGIPVFVALGLSSVVVAALSWPMSFVMLRLKDGEFAIGMWVLASTCHLLVNLDPLIQGETGTSLIAFNSYDPELRRQILFLFALGSAAVVLGLLFWLLRSRYGAALQAIRDDDEAAGSLGVEVLKSKRLIFVFSAFGAAIAGALWLGANISFQPKSYFGVQWTAYMIFMVLVGGIGTFEGAVLGAIIFFVIETFFAAFGVWYLIGLGGAAIVFSLGFPQGVWGAVVQKWDLHLLPIGRRLTLTREPNSTQTDD